eukprot:gnl/Carplike_NY0171/4429_a6015_237.p1 GENE.gnl/Carplike_NY0171/4429_a6015_237~~gnl/Carplike_NY0171/4429_a6015_237.p1  ORF type:complete len:147 (-),score=10.87 gnl/Carplike_NY0171/4429_a6015_237:111-551(-)
MGLRTKKERQVRSFATSMVCTAQKEMKTLLVAYGDGGEAYKKCFSPTSKYYPPNGSTKWFPDRVKKQVEAANGFFVTVDEYHTSKLCPVCHAELKTIDAKNRIRQCPNCGVTGNRDCFAAQNIAMLGLLQFMGKERPHEFCCHYYE